MLATWRSILSLYVNTMSVSLGEIIKQVKIESRLEIGQILLINE
jgi:hypothetical protein